jgi:hypothetical protein
MRNIESRLKALEQKAGTMYKTGDYCRIHVPLPVIRFADGVEEPPKEQQDFCPICKKKYAPETQRTVIDFFSDSKWG